MLNNLQTVFFFKFKNSKPKKKSFFFKILKTNNVSNQPTLLVLIFWKSQYVHLKLNCYVSTCSMQTYASDIHCLDFVM